MLIRLKTINLKCYKFCFEINILCFATTNVVARKETEVSYLSTFVIRIIYSTLKPALRYTASQPWWLPGMLGSLRDTPDFGKYSRFSSFSTFARSTSASEITKEPSEENLRRRNTVVVILMIIAVLAAIAVILGITLYFLYHKGIEENLGFFFTFKMIELYDNHI